MMKFYALLLLIFPCILLAQEELLIEHLPNTINTYDAEFNFVQKDDNTGYYTASREEEGLYKSSIYNSTFKYNTWGKGKYSVFNSDNFSTGNISFSTVDGRTYFDICKGDNSNIVYVEKNKTKGFNRIKAIELKGTNNKQPNISKYGTQQVMYFVSDRPGGYGGLDIWLCMIDQNGTFGAPINVGAKINTESNEITPFYNQTEGVLYFSSDHKKGKGGFDIYRALGKLNLWGYPKNVSELNTDKNETYLTFYTQTKGHFSSNRKQARYRGEEEYCCMDIFSFEYRKVVESDLIQEIALNLPLTLYFHNDEPDCCTMRTTTEKNYKDAYISYFKMQEEYLRMTNNNVINSFFKDSLKNNFNHLELVLEAIYQSLLNGEKIELLIKGFASPLHDSKYNINLSKRRINSLINYLSLYNNRVLVSFIKSKKLMITELPYGESRTSEKVSDNPNNKQQSIFSIEAMLERKIIIVGVKNQ